MFLLCERMGWTFTEYEAQNWALVCRAREFFDGLTLGRNDATAG